MANLLKGKDVADNIAFECNLVMQKLKGKGITPTLAIVRVGSKDSDLSYEKGIEKKCESFGVNVKKVVFDKVENPDDFYNAIEDLNKDTNVHGILLFRPLPEPLSDSFAADLIDPDKDVDGCSQLSLSGIFTGSGIGFCPATAEAVVKTLDYYNIDVEGKKVCILGRSLVIGKPVSMLLLNRNATVTICHSRSNDVHEVTKNADIVVVATGKMQSFDQSYVSEGQTIIDVGIHFNEETGKLCGDVVFDEVEPIVANITPVPGGIGSVTTSVLLQHVIYAAERI